MSGNAFTANVKPGGLTNSTQIRILLCTLIAHAAHPPTKEELEQALLKEALVNYFELASSLSELESQQLVELDDEGCYRITAAGEAIVQTLRGDVPTSVQECAQKALRAMQKAARNLQDYQVDIIPCQDGFHLCCSIQENGMELFSVKIYMPDFETAQKAKIHFIENGSDIHKLLLSTLTGSDRLVQMLLKGVTL